MHADAIVRGQRPGRRRRPATGGTMKACCDLVQKLGGEIVGVTPLTNWSASGPEEAAVSIHWLPIRLIRRRSRRSG
jgi:hypothetical protein